MNQIDVLNRSMDYKELEMCAVKESEESFLSQKVSDVGMPILSDLNPQGESNSAKKVRFEPTCKVILIPCIAEYKSAGLVKTLWFSKGHEKAAGKTARIDIMQYEDMYRISQSTAIKFLYHRADLKGAIKSVYRKKVKLG